MEERTPNGELIYVYIYIYICIYVYGISYLEINSRLFYLEMGLFSYLSLNVPDFFFFRKAFRWAIYWVHSTRELVKYYSRNKKTLKIFDIKDLHLILIVAPKGYDLNSR